MLKEIETTRNRENELRMRMEAFEKYEPFTSTVTNIWLSCFLTASAFAQIILLKVLCQQDLSNSRGEGQDHRRPAKEARSGSEDHGGHIRPKAK